MGYCRQVRLIARHKILKNNDIIRRAVDTGGPDQLGDGRASTKLSSATRSVVNSRSRAVPSELQPPSSFVWRQAISAVL